MDGYFWEASWKKGRVWLSQAVPAGAPFSTHSWIQTESQEDAFMSNEL